MTASMVRPKFSLPCLYWKPKLWQILLLAFLAFALAEAGHFTSIWLTLQNAARWGVRYAVTGSFDNRYCDEAVTFYRTHTRVGSTGGRYLTAADEVDEAKCEVQPNAALDNDYTNKTAVVQRLAALLSTYDAAVGGAPAILAQAGAAAHAAALDLATAPAASNQTRLTVCSTRVSYDAARMTCVPRDDAGGNGDRVLVGISYNYPVVGWLGEPITYLPLQAVRQGIVESFRISREVVLPPGSVVGSDAPANTTPLPATEARLVIVTADLQLVVADVDASLQQAVRLADEAGGYIVLSRAGYDGEYRYAEAQLRVPAEKFQATLAQIKGLAQVVTQETTQGEDVTEEYVDLQARRDSLKATAAQIETLLDKSKTVAEALQVNTELGKLNAEIDRLTGRMNYLENRDQYATLTLTLTPQRPATAPPPVNWQPLATFQRAVHFLGGLAYFGVDILIWLVVVGLPVGLVLLAARWLIRRRRPKN